MTHLPSLDLYDRIINRINYEKKLLRLKRRLFWFSSGLLVSAAVLVPLAQKFYADLAQSGLPQTFSLLFSDFPAVKNNLNDFVFSLLEAVPAASAGLALSVLLIFLFNLAKTYDFWLDFKRVRRLI